MLFLVFFIVVALLVALKGNKKFILFFMAFYPVLPDYFAIELGGGLPLLKASRILLLILMLCVCFRNKKIKLIRKPLKAAGLYWPLIIYFAARILAIAIACLDLSNYTGSRRCVSVRENNRRCKWNNSSYQHYQCSDWVEFVLFFEYGISERFNGVYGKNGHHSCRSYFWASGILCNVLRTYYSFGIVYVAK